MVSPGNPIPDEALTRERARTRELQNTTDAQADRIAALEKELEKLRGGGTTHPRRRSGMGATLAPTSPTAAPSGAAEGDSPAESRSNSSSNVLAETKSTGKPGALAVPPVPNIRQYYTFCYN